MAGMAGDPLQKFSDSMSRAITKISVKTSSSLEKSKIKMHIESIAKEEQKMLADIGEEVYSLWIQGDSFNQILLEKLDVIKQKKDEIQQLKIELNSIDERDNEIFGTKMQAELQEEAQVITKLCCPNCGNECEHTAKFCRKCGSQLSK